MSKIFKPNSKVGPIESTWTSPTPTPKSMHSGLYTPIFTPGSRAAPSKAAVPVSMTGVNVMSVFGPQPRTKNTI